MVVVVVRMTEEVGEGGWVGWVLGWCTLPTHTRWQFPVQRGSHTGEITDIYTDR